MATAKIQFKLGAIEFSGEGDEVWLSSELDKFIKQTPELLKLAPPTISDDAGVGGTDKSKDFGDISKDIPLGTFLKDKNVGSVQVNRFLATAIWLYGRGSKTPSTVDVTKALSDNHQSKLNNPADCLIKNVTKGFCEKQGKQFFVTPDGFSSMK